MGGSTNTVLHTLAAAYEAGLTYPLERINEVATRVPHICKVSPSSHWHMEDVHRAGGIPAILKEISRPGRRPASGPTHLVGQNPGRKHRGRRDPGHGSHPEPRKCLLIHGRSGGPVRQPRSGGCGHQDGRGRRSPAAPRSRSSLRERRSGDAGHPGWRGKGGRGGRHPLRRSAGRTRNAGDARPDGPTPGHGPRREGGPRLPTAGSREAVEACRSVMSVRRPPRGDRLQPFEMEI